MSINSIEVRIHLNYKFNLRLSNFIINSSILFTLFLNFCLQSTLNCSVTSSSHTYLQRSALCSMPWSRLLWYVVEEYFGGKNCSPCARATGQGNHFECIPTVSMSTFHRRSNLSWLSKICNRFGEIAAGSRKSLTLIKPKWRFFGKKDPLRAYFQKCFRKPHRAHGNASFCANFVKFGRPEVVEIAHCLMDKKTKFRLVLPLPLLRGSRPKFVRDISKQYTRSSPNFIQIRSLPVEL